jgi:hypothetical protein
MQESYRDPTQFDLPPVPFVWRDDYLDQNLDGGRMTTRAGTRLVVMPEELIRGLHEALHHEAGAAWSLIAYTCGRRWGERLSDTIDREWRHYHGQSFEQADFPVFEGGLEAYFDFYGWADLEIDFSREREGIVQFWLADSIFDRLLGGDAFDGAYVNEIFAGVLGAMTSRLAGRELECLEIQSAAEDSVERSRLAVALPERIEEARHARLDGADVEELLEILQH